MFPFLTIFIIFIIVLTYFRKKGTEEQKAINERFWQQEVEANSVRRKDISGLNYISIPLDKFPLDLHTESEEILRSLASKRIINLTNFTNTQLKLQYGAANLEELGSYESNYILMEKTLSAYASELLDANRPADARAVLEFAVDCGADVSEIYLMLGNLYRDQKDENRLAQLLEKASQLETPTKDALVDKLQESLSAN